ncbi:TPA: adenosylcobinamide-GDP ribazoletransferase [Candidatus Bathyarchaeota archaeon]|nr:adenosylcobinamide-GDP ribazoletransferase [Candidatus Bathyarchaeota archaeon]
MKALREFKSVMAFLTAIPVGGGSLEDMIDGVHYFPLVGALVGALAGAFGWLTLRSLPNLLAGSLTVGLLFLLTGLHHMDGLADFGDGLMARGSREDKLGVMGNFKVGIGGLTLALMVTLSSIFAVSQLPLNSVVQGLTASEVSAKLSMVFLALISRPARAGLGSKFIKGVKNRGGAVKFFVALISSLAIAFFALSLVGVLMLAVGLSTAATILAVSAREFGGATGDVLGAANEISRMASLIALLVVS